jgi:hypothetical protein
MMFGRMTNGECEFWDLLAKSAYMGLGLLHRRFGDLVLGLLEPLKEGSET